MLPGERVDRAGELPQLRAADLLEPVRRVPVGDEASPLREREGRGHVLLEEEPDQQPVRREQRDHEAEERAGVLRHQRAQGGALLAARGRPRPPS